ncbi:putative mitochondrial FG-GAP repeat protein, putative,intergrin alpha chain protein [Leptomonas pyrrhocoris]|uniref:Putative mitochondrial FG-GAP repeat protein, putative,intergrin alpha chain protein n=1 Tax=Leptomonas pyrrhocoris TaxID=157538 RepID=A0A0M9FQW0_LEPPY|nr:putative mitochondrial FG-GAP repeat protein, putative,intergrin alpha chain protein [Leptomonas pyrrhocoris]XP_015652445.1 putative mitochondrial FG-GAP repeat protein, putative,intergrin alpha chain protein [Leptomonas pyrrhocoris]XP_015652446.1 putative mitochondrial FG-GAP repeat protein, putative,intergrin alpha chain protein [Leptomonas pyrrhocoris]KPA74005.1 putative mitochondrial FG-GAP repeat protein, putative,intergrin alpha chain protein [Leptomonas pyrrhocoris]KPA74006.1 putative|eukprot:XP_015652444.1 putative mitochondrial FG-GAP repeat protein, putative,intergrin alpha chain protein [Leptomonas pyrrhocoris]
MTPKWRCLVLCALLWVMAAQAQTLKPNATSKCFAGINLEWSARVGSSVYATPRIVDLGNDGRREILIPTFSQFLEALDGSTGEDVPGFPFMHPRMKTYASPLPVDLNGDGQVDWLVALYTGELVIFGADGRVQGYLKVPPLAMKKNWVKDKLPPREAATVKPGTPIHNAAVLEEIMSARRMDDLFVDVVQLRQQRFHPSARQRNGFQAQTADADAVGVGGVPDGETPVKTEGVEDEANFFVDDDVRFDTGFFDEDRAEVRWNDAKNEIGPTSHLSPEAKESLSLLFHPELYRAAEMEKETNDFGGRNLRPVKNITIGEDEIEVEAHLLSTPVVTDVDGNNDLDVILHVSYFFSAEVVARHRKEFPGDINLDDYVATAVVCMNLVTGGTRWARVLHASTKRGPNVAYGLSTPLVINADEDRQMEVYVSTTLGFLFGFTQDGGALDGWPVLLGPLSASPTAEDVTGDGKLDICIGDTEGKVRCYNSTGSANWEADVVGGIADRLTFGDVDGDGVVDVVFGTTSGLIYALSGNNGTALPSFPIVTGGAIVAPALLLNLDGIIFSQGVDIVVPSHDGRVYLVRETSGCVETIDIDEKSSSMVLADDISGNGQMDLLVTTINGGVYLFETATPYSPMNAWPSKTKGVNGCSASGNYVGVFIEPAFRAVRNIQGDTMTLQITIYDARKGVAQQRYVVDIVVGTRIRVHHQVFSTPGTHTLKIRAPLERVYSSLNVILTLPNGQVFTDSIPLSFNMHFMDAIKYTLVIPFLAVSLALVLVHKRHEVADPEPQYLY